MRSYPLSRREMLHWSAGTLLSLGIWPGRLRAADADSADFTFAVVNDTHYQTKRCGDWLERVIQQMKDLPHKIDCCLLAGDLVEHGTPAELAAMRDLLPQLGVPVHVVPGNHDYRAQDDRKPYDDLFPDRLNYRFEHKGWQFVGLDSSDGLRYQKVAVQPATLSWLDDNVPKFDKKKPTVIFTHFPLGPTVTHRSTNADAVLERFKEHNLQAVFGGHFHGFTERKLGAVTLTTNRCCSFSRGNHDGTKEKGFFLCRVKDGKIERSFVEAKT